MYCLPQYSKYVHSMRELVCIYTRVQYVSRYMYAGVGGGGMRMTRSYSVYYTYIKHRP